MTMLFIPTTWRRNAMKTDVVIMTSAHVSHVYPQELTTSKRRNKDNRFHVYSWKNGDVSTRHI